jgi:hypothetical protein
MEYTKGEWKRKGNIITVVDEDGDAYIIAKLPPPLDGGAKEFIDNTRLIMTAPEMYEVLREAENQIDYMQDKFTETGTGNTVINKIRHVLKKAEGYTI